MGFNPNRAEAVSSANGKGSQVVYTTGERPNFGRGVDYYAAAIPTTLARIAYELRTTDLSSN